MNSISSHLNDLPLILSRVYGRNNYEIARCANEVGNLCSVCCVSSRMHLAPPSRLSVSAIATLTSKCPDGLCNLAPDAIASSPWLNPRLAAWFGGEVGPIAEATAAHR